MIMIFACWLILGKCLLKYFSLLKNQKYTFKLAQIKLDFSEICLKKNEFRQKIKTFDIKTEKY